MAYDFKTFTFGVGAHNTRKEGMCVMEAVAYIAGEEHTDRPKCACPVISAFIRAWNDRIREDDLRCELVGQFVFRLPGTRATKQVEEQRRWMCVDFAAREAAPEFLSLIPELRCHADALRALPEITAENWKATWPTVEAARDAARNARYATWRRYRSEAVEAAVVAVVAVAVAVEVAVVEVAVAAVVEAAVVEVAARRSLQPAIGATRQSAVRLVDRMIRLTEPQEVVPLTQRETVAS